MNYQNPTVDDFKLRYARDFPFNNVDPLLGVTDADIANAFQITNVQINAELFPSQDVYTLAYLSLAAHYLVTSLQHASVGIGGYSFAETSKSVGSVSQSFAVPQWMLENPLFHGLATTNYGALYLQWILPAFTGRVYSIPGSTRP